MNLKSLLTITGITTCLALPCLAEVFEFTTEELAPFNFLDKSDGKLKGIAIDLLHDIMKDQGFTYQKDYVIKMMPWARAYDQALQKPNTCAFATYATEKRLPLFQWVGPLLTAKWSFYAKKGSGIKLSSLPELANVIKTHKENKSPFIIGGYGSDAPTGFVKDYLKDSLKMDDNEVKRIVDEAPDNNNNILKLSDGKIQLWATGDPAGAYMAKMAGKSDQIENIFTFQEIPMSISCNKGFSSELIAKMQKTLDRLEKSGDADKYRRAH